MLTTGNAMLLSEEEMTTPYQIKSYAPGKIVVNEITYTNSILISTQTLITDWRPQVISELNIGDFEFLINQTLEIFLLGTGKQQVFPPAKLLAQCPIGYEIMSTSAACRTFNLLANEGRNVIAGLMP